MHLIILGVGSLVLAVVGSRTNYTYMVLVLTFYCTSLPAQETVLCADRYRGFLVQDSLDNCGFKKFATFPMQCRLTSCG